MKNFLITSEIKCLIITLVIELFVGLVITRKKEYIPMFILVNILTNPLLSAILFYININYGLDLRRIAWFILEIIVVIVEGLIYKKAFDDLKINPLFLSLILNLSSIIFGELIDYYII